MCLYDSRFREFAESVISHKSMSRKQIKQCIRYCFSVLDKTNRKVTPSLSKTIICVLCTHAV
jgi:predicted transcriptional regulator